MINRDRQIRNMAFLALLALCGCDKGHPPETVVVQEQPLQPSQTAHETSAARTGALERIQAAKVLRIGVKSDTPPFCFQDKDGNPQGFDVDLGFRLARALNVQPLFITVTAAERIDRLAHGDVDVIIATLTATRRRAHEIDFSIPYFQDQQGLLVKTGSAIQSYRDLAHKRVASIAGSTSIDNIKVVSPDCEVVAVKTLAEGIEKLRSGDADAMTEDGLQLQALRLEDANLQQFRMAGEGFSVEPYVIGMARNDAEFRVRVDEILTDLWNSGTWTRLFNKWLGAQSPYNLEAHFQMPVLPP